MKKNGMKKGALLVGISLLALSFSGCGGNDGSEESVQAIEETESDISNEDDDTSDEAINRNMDALAGKTDEKAQSADYVVGGLKRMMDWNYPARFKEERDKAFELLAELDGKEITLGKPGTGNGFITVSEDLPHKYQPDTYYIYYGEYANSMPEGFGVILFPAIDPFFPKTVITFLHTQANFPKEN